MGDGAATVSTTKGIEVTYEMGFGDFGDSGIWDLGILELGFVLVWEGIGRKRDFGVWVEKKRERKWRKVESWWLWRLVEMEG
ncbi:hypothetical protein C1H46_000267 [Malus baccata]|uniref:Uncharacterized protein n=1 Tax=Malus baccata TaxID=106549 RepID=A0A540NTI0_MALBA|nr:hypothetical protein C1H46_000267 [Malus baccata]